MRRAIPSSGRTGTYLSDDDRSGHSTPSGTSCAVAQTVASATLRRLQDLPRGATPFPTKNVQRGSSLSIQRRRLLKAAGGGFQIGGGRIETREFHSPAELNSLPERVILNCTGYGARALWSDESIVPVRGQIAWLIPQEGVHYGIYYTGLNVLARRDGIVVQPFRSEEEGWNDANEQPDKAAAVAGVEVIQELYSRMEKMPHPK